MTTTNFACSAGDKHIVGQSATYATARGTSYTENNYVDAMELGQAIIGGSLYYICRDFLLFDTSAIPDTDTITQVNLKLVATHDTSANDFDVVIKKLDWSALTREQAYDGCLTADSDDSIWRNTSGMSINTQYTSGNLSTAWINKTGITYYALINSRDLAGTPPDSAAVWDYINIASGNHGTAGYRPVLTVIHGPAATALTAADFTLAPVTFDAPTLTNVTGTEDLTAADFTLSAVTFEKPTLEINWNTPACRTLTVEAESRTLAIPAESRGLKITCNSATLYAPSHTYNGLTAKDLTLNAATFDAPVLSIDGYWLMDADTSAQYGGATTLNNDQTFAATYTDIPGAGAIRHRIRQHGYIKSVQLRTTGVSVIKFKIFRPSGTDFAFIGESEQVTFQSGTTTQALATPIECMPGDLLGVYVVSGRVSATSLANGALYKSGDITSTWTGGDEINYCLSITGYGVSPYLAVTGDSISSGNNVWQSFYDSGPAGTLTSEPWYVLRGLIDSSQSGGFEYQNHGASGKTFGWVLSTGFVSALATGSKVVLIHCGVNDIYTNRTWAAVLSDLNAIKVLFAASTTATRLIIDEILPWSNGDDTQAATVRTWNANLAAWVTTNNDIAGKTIVLATIHDAMGQTRVSTGELDDLLTAYDDDGVHLTAAGYAKMAELLQPYMS